MSDISSATAHPVFDRADASASHFAALNAVMVRLLATRRTVVLVRVQAVEGAGLNPVGFVDVQPLVHQQNAAGQVSPHGVLYQVPYFRLQGGSRAVVLDPEVGDIGLALVADRDISNAKTARGAAAPGSFRQHNMADALYLGGFLNAAPQDYIWLHKGGITLHTSGTVQLTAQNIKIEGNTTISGTLSVSGDVTGKGISLAAHTHGGVQAGSGTTTKPV